MTRRYSKLDRLGLKAQRIVIAGHRKCKTAQEIRRDLEKAFGSLADIPTNSGINLALRGLMAEEKRVAAMAEQAEALMRAAKAVPGTPAELLMALAKEALLTHKKKFRLRNPLEIQHQGLEAQRVQNKTRELALKERSARGKPEKKTKRTVQLTPERIAEIRREYYGSEQ